MIPADSHAAVVPMCQHSMFDVAAVRFMFKRRHGIWAGPIKVIYIFTVEKECHAAVVPNLLQCYAMRTLHLGRCEIQVGV